MTRIIKFRAWEKYFAVPKSLQGKVFKMRYYSLNELHLMTNKKDIMQFTGLKDKNGKEIYEGDIVKTENLENIRKTSKGIWIVIWNEFSCCFDGERISNEEDDTGEDYESIGNFKEYNVKVIGNIYENPELMETGK